jgi:hypothetical protein
MPGGHWLGGGDTSGGGGAGLRGTHASMLVEYCVPGGQAQYGGLPVMPGGQAAGAIGSQYSPAWFGWSNCR